MGTQSFFAAPPPVAFTGDYQALVTSEHRLRPNFMEWVAANVQPFVDIQNLIAQFPQLFDVDVAVGNQLDILGTWIGQSRSLPVPLTGVYFTLGPTGPGFGIGTWFSPGDSLNGLVTLPDDSYRVLLKGVIARNNWNGTKPGAYSVWNTIFSDVGAQIFISDFQDCSIALTFNIPTMTAVIQALIANGFLDMVAAGVQIIGYFQPSLPLASTPMFGLGIENSTIAGFGVGAWVEPLYISGEDTPAVGSGSYLITPSSIPNAGFVIIRY